MKRKIKIMRTIMTAVSSVVVSLVAGPALALDFPLHANDLNPGERVWTTVHATGGGPQTGAKDLLILRHVADNDWENLKAGATDQSVNSNYLVYGRPVYAMASGTVIGCWRNAPQNSGHTLRPEVGTGKILLQGNHLWILQTDGTIALYAHAITGDIPASLCPNNNVFLTGTALGGPIWTQPEATVTNGATVTAGQLLFHAGNSGNASEPHLHVHVVDSSNTWQPMHFDRGMTTPFTNNTASEDGPWTPLHGAALPMATILVWPPHPIGNWTYNGIAPSAYQRVFDHFADSGEMLDSVTCSGGGTSWNTTWIPAQGFWLSLAGISPATYSQDNATFVSQGYTRVFFSTCGSTVSAIWRKP
jgi:hypothetical protein